MMWRISTAAFLLWGFLLAAWYIMARGAVTDGFWWLSLLWVVQGAALWYFIRSEGRK